MGLFRKKNQSSSKETDEKNKPTDIKTDEKQSFFKRMSLKFQTSSTHFRHRKIERLIRTFFIAIAIFVFGGAYSIYHGTVVQKEKLQAITPIGSSVSFSKTGATLTTTKPYISADEKTAFVPFTFSSMEDLTTDAERYYTLIGSTQNILGYSPLVQFILFGETGRGSFIIHGKPKVTSEVIQLYLRNDKLLISEKDSEASSLDGSLAGLNEAAKLYDLIYLVVNPAAKNVTREKKLNTMKVDAEVLYATLFANEDVKEIQETIKSSRKAIEVLNVRILEYEERLTRDGYTIPKHPPYLAADWKPKDALDIDLDGTLEKGLIRSEVETEKLITPEDIELETQDEDLSEDYFTLDETVKRDDGTLASEEVNIVEGQVSPQETWETLITMYEEVHSLKSTIYENEAMNLYKIQKSVERQSKTISISTGDRFSIMGATEK